MVFAGVGVVLATLTAGIVLWQTLEPINTLPKFPDPSSSPMGSYATAAVSCDAPLCADIGK